MKFIPILFSTPMVQAILEDRKTVTRRLIKSKHESGLFQVARRMTDNAIVGITSLDWDECTAGNSNDIQPKCKAGDILWVRETWRPIEQDFGSPRYEYRATEMIDTTSKWKPSIFMPKPACRLFLEVVSVRPERLQDITEEDAIKEGVKIDLAETMGYTIATPKSKFKSLWQSINGEESWNTNPWVWVISFKKIERPENFLPA